MSKIFVEQFIVTKKVEPSIIAVFYLSHRVKHYALELLKLLWLMALMMDQKQETIHVLKIRSGIKVTK
uniref:Uncharacterized protein n=1 Tax=Trichogramma kaykai TaxID=54128 RepID=A0ABD2XAF9_9HYME